MLRVTLFILIIFTVGVGQSIFAADNGAASGAVAGYRVVTSQYLVNIATEVYHDERVWKEIAYWNNIQPPYVLSRGQILILRNLARGQRVPSENRVIAAELATARASLAAVVPSTRKRASVERELSRGGRGYIYVVNERAPSLSMVARDLYGDRRYFGEIAQWNGLSPDAKLSLGQRLVISRAPTVSLEEGTAVLASAWESLGNDDMVRRLGEEPVGVRAVAPAPTTAYVAPTPSPEEKIIPPRPVTSVVAAPPAVTARSKASAKNIKPPAKAIEPAKVMRMLSSTTLPKATPKVALVKKPALTKQLPAKREPIVAQHEPAVAPHAPAVAQHEPIVAQHEPIVARHQQLTVEQDPTAQPQPATPPPMARQQVMTIITSTRYMPPLRVPPLIARPRVRIPTREPASVAAAQAQPTAATRLPKPGANRQFVFMAPPVATCGCANGAIAMCVPASALIPMSSFEINNTPPPKIKLAAAPEPPSPVPVAAPASHNNLAAPQVPEGTAPQNTISSDALMGQGATPVYVTVPVGVPGPVPVPTSGPAPMPERAPASPEEQASESAEKERRYWLGQDSEILIETLTRQLVLPSKENPAPDEVPADTVAPYDSH